MTISKDNLMELLATRATEGLSPSQEDELNALLREHPGVDAEAIERAAAAVHLAGMPEPEVMPASLRVKLEQDAAAHFGHAPSADSDNVTRLEPRRAATAPTTTAWPWLAAAAALVLAVLGWWPITDPVAPTFTEQRAALIDQGAVVIDWTATEDPTAVNVTGDVVWNAVTGQGFMRFDGLAANLPTEFQYQLWVFDATRDERYPVDGGVFDIPQGDGEVVVPIRTQVPINEAVLFAVTIEAPGGVVVSDRERIAVLAELS